MRRSMFGVAALVAAGVLWCSGVPAASAATQPVSTTALAAADGWTCALLSTHQIKCWGYNGEGELGLGDTNNRGDGPNQMGDNLPAIDLGAGRTATSVDAVEGHACAVLDNSTIKCWGYNVFGQLGLGDTNNRGDGASEMGDNLPVVDLGTERTAKAVVVGLNHTCAILDNDTVKCWGQNSFGKLGLGDTNHRGDAASEMGDSLPAVDLGTGRTAKALALGSQHTCALLDNNTVKCWGYNSWGQLGRGYYDTVGDGANEMGDTLPAVDLGSGRTAKSLRAAGSTTCAILDNDTVKCWGDNGTGQLGLGDTNHRGDGANEMGDNLPAVDLGTGRTAKAISVGPFHVCALLDNNTVKCWGRNNQGQLGQSDTSDRGSGANQMGDNLPAVNLGTGRVSLVTSAGFYTSCAVLDTYAVKCWGYNSGGELGLGDTSTRGDGPNEMGDNLPTIDVGTEAVLPPTGSNAVSLVLCALGLLSVGTGILMFRRRTA